VFKVRREEKEAAREAALREFEDWVVAHVERCLPDRWTVLGETGVREVIRLGIERAAAHGIEAERDVCKLVDLMLVFGVDFDSERRWAREILSAKEDQFVRMRRLFERGIVEEASA
jgi:hypothetical protein